ncbi:hypothetical protein RFH42_03290 [Acinetobacter rudis]|uniref:hypothetical protein n=1 Tax=Acinetobacter rudis TaxID=632955 RepID=UPI00280F3877|nr:hypothetical protein [Acinetobacter rudis]MDQ8951978.1 hypothetical protein [Acinetobacter rudis]
MTEHCKNTGNWLEMCEALSEVTRNEYGDIQAQRMSHRAADSVRLQIVAGRFKKNRVVLNHCPFCGVDIRTKHKESAA